MSLRFLVIALSLAVIAWLVDREQQAGRFQDLDHAYLDALTICSLDRLNRPEAEAGTPVTLIEMREEDRKEYTSWPPSPLDWQIILKAVQAYDPNVLVITTPLNWGRPTPDFVPAVGEALRPFPNIVLGIESQMAETPSTAPAFMGDLGTVLPRFQQITGELSSVQSLAALISAPEPAVRSTAELGVISQRQEKKEWLLPYVVKSGDELIPAVLAQVMTRYSHSTYATDHRLSLHPTGATAYLSDGFVVPLRSTGELVIRKEVPVPRINALNLMAGDLADGISETDKAALGKGRVIVIGTTSATGPSIASLHAAAIQQLLTQPRLFELPPLIQWPVRILIGAIGFCAVFRTRGCRALLAGVIAFLSVLILSLLLFKSSLIWFPPAVPMALLVSASVLGTFGGKPKRISPSAPPSAASESPANA